MQATIALFTPLFIFFLCPSLLAQNLINNGDFEANPFNSSWTSASVITETGLNGSATAARLGYNTTATLGQAVTPQPDFTFDAYVQVAGNTTSQSFRILLDCAGGNALEIRGTLGNVLQVNHQGTFYDLTKISDSSNFPVPGNSPVRIRVVGKNWGTAEASYDIAWSDPSSTTLSHSSSGLTSFTIPGAVLTGNGLNGVRFDRNNTASHSHWVDDVTITAGTTPVPVANYQLILPLPDKVVNIAGVYPHLAVTSSHLEIGFGAIVPWANKLWAITYGPHIANGDTTNKLYEIDSALSLIARPESAGGTPANRFIHSPSNQLVIGPHFVDSTGNVRTLPYSLARGRHTGTAAHLTDPANRVYIMTMENGVYDVNVNDLSFITRYPDVQGKGDRFLHGYHGKGLYSGQGLLVAANNGRPGSQGSPTGETGVLASWDGTTVADNGGSYLAGNDPNTGIGDNSGAPVAAQPEYIAGWNQHFKVQHCEVTGPGGIHGNPNPATDPVWATGFDAKSVVLRTLENGNWHTWRLPKGSYSHDGSHGWHTEWPRIRQLDPSTQNSPYLMHMHGLFLDFPKTFSSTNFSGLTPISGYYKMPVDYCMFNGKLVIAKNDASKFSNTLALKAQSNMWWGDYEDLQDWGAPTGHGSVWLNESITSDQSSDPFLINGFSQGTLHLRNNGTTSVPIAIQTTSGDGNWTTKRTVNVVAGSYLHDNISDLTNEWVRLTTNAASSDFTAFFHLSNPYPHTSIASKGTDRYAALADIRDTSGYSDGMIRVMSGNDLKLEFASDSGYHRIGGQIALEDVTDASAESNFRSDATLTQEFGSDAASAWLESSGTRFRVPKLDPLYDGPFLSGWARGEREAVTERKLFNLHGTFYEIPRDNSGGKRKMRALATHGKRITDFASWRGLFVLTGVLDDAAASDSLVKNPSGNAALWLGEIDELWKMGEPRGVGGPWKNTAVTAGAASDPYLMYGYDEKKLELSHTSGSSVTFTVEVDFLADNSWSTYDTFTVASGETFTHTFPAGFHAHWVRVKSDTTTTATSQFTYGPAGQRDEFLDWARDQGLPTASGRAAVAAADGDNNNLADIVEYMLGSNPNTFSQDESTDVTVVVRDVSTEDAIAVVYELSNDLDVWTPRNDLVSPDPDQSGVPTSFTRQRFSFPTPDTNEFMRIRFNY